MNNYSNKKGSVQALKKIFVTDFMALQLSLFLIVFFFFFLACMRTDDQVTTS